MIKLGKSEGRMKKLKISALVAGFVLAVVALIGVGAPKTKADAVSLEPGTKIPIRQLIKSNGAEDLTGTFSYSFEETDGLNAISNLPTNTKIVLNNTPFINGEIERRIDAVLSQVTVNAIPGEYKVKITCSSNLEYFACNSAYYTFSIFVENILNPDRTPSGNYRASIGNLRRVVNGREYESKLEEAYFYSEEELPPEPVYTYVTLKNTVEGDLAKETDVFKYVITIDGPEDVLYTIISPSGKYKFGEEEVISDTEVYGGRTAVIYLRHGEVATIGLSDDEEPIKQILVGTAYSYVEYPDVKEYKTWIDDKEKGERVEVSKIAGEDPEDNLTLYINSYSKPTIPEVIEEIVNTGLRYKNGAFVVLAAGALVVVLSIISQRAKKKS